MSWTIELRNSPGIQKKGGGRVLNRMKEKSREMEARARWDNISLTGDSEGENEKNGEEDNL